MKTKKVLGYGLIAVMLALAFTACDDGNTGGGGGDTQTHTWGAWQETTVPTCTTAGIETRACTVCGTADTQTQEGTAALGHDMGEWITTAPTVTANGKEEYTCKRPGCTYVEETKSILALSYFQPIGSNGNAVSAELATAYRIVRPVTNSAYPEVYNSAGWQATEEQRNIVPPPEVIYIPDTYEGKPVTEIGNQHDVWGIGAFQGRTNITAIHIPDTITSINTMAFVECTFTSIEIPESVTTIGNQAFLGCTNILSITIPESVTHVDVIAFGRWTATQTIFIRGFASQTEADNAWGYVYNDEYETWVGWRASCDAVIKYWNGTTWE